MKNIKSIIFNSESFKFDDSNYAKLDQVNNFSNYISVNRNISIEQNNNTSYMFFNGYDNANAPENLKRSFIIFGNNNSYEPQNIPAHIGFSYNTNGNTFIEFRVRKTLDRHEDSDTYYGLRVAYSYELDRSLITCNPPDMNSNNNEIATTSWVNAKIANFANVNVISDENQITEDGIYFIVE